MDNSFNSCVKEVGHEECGLGTLCDNECMPPFYFTTSIITLLSSVGLTPVVIVCYLYEKIKERKSRN